MIRRYISRGSKRFQQEIAKLAESPDVKFSVTDDTVKMTLYHMPNTCPTTYQIHVGADYPRTPPVVMCLDDSFENKYINHDKVLTHPDIRQRWIFSYGITNIIQTARIVSFMFDHSRTPKAEAQINSCSDDHRRYDEAAASPTRATASACAIDLTTDFQCLSLSAKQPPQQSISVGIAAPAHTAVATPSARTPPSSHYPSHLCTTYIRDNVGVDEDKFFKAAGVLLYRWDTEKGMQVLLGQDARSRYMWTLLGGKKDGKENIWATAIREFNEETGKVLDPSHSGSGGISSIQSSLEGICQSSQTTEGVQMCWYGDGKYALFLVNVDSVPGLRIATNDITHLFNRFLYDAHTVGKECREMSEVKWLRVGDLMGPQTTIKLSRFCRNIFKDRIFRKWLVACEDFCRAAACGALNGGSVSSSNAGTDSISSSPVRGKSVGLDDYTIFPVSSITQTVQHGETDENGSYKGR